MNNIEIFDSFLNKKDLTVLEEYILSKTFYHRHVSGFRDAIINTFFSVELCDEFFSEYIVKKIEEKTKKKFILARNYVHVQTFGLDGCFHIDDTGEFKYTFCLYLTDVNENEIENAGGDFLIKCPNEKHVIAINTSMNRGIFFPSNYLHKGIAYNRFFENRRICLTWKLIEIVL